MTLTQGGEAGAREVDLEKSCAQKRAAHKSFSVFSPSSNVPSAHTTLRRLAVDALSTRPRVCQCTERVTIAHVWCTQQRSLDSHLVPLGQTSAQSRRPARFRGSAKHCTRAASHQAPFLPSPRPTSRCASVPVGGRRCSPRSPRRGRSSVLPSQNRSPRAAVRPPIPPLPADAAALAPTAPSPPRSGYRLMKCSFSSVICFVFLQSSDK